MCMVPLEILERFLRWQDYKHRQLYLSMRLKDWYRKEKNWVAPQILKKKKSMNFFSNLIMLVAVIF